MRIHLLFAAMVAVVAMLPLADDSSVTVNYIGKRISYSYDEAGNRIRKIYNPGVTTSYHLEDSIETLCPDTLSAPVVNPEDPRRPRP